MRFEIEVFRYPPKSTPRRLARTVYNFEFADNHKYYVGEAGVWVHNEDCGSRDTGNSTPIGAVPLNPERDSVFAMASDTEDTQPLAA